MKTVSLILLTLLVASLGIFIIMLTHRIRSNFATGEENHNSLSELKRESRVHGNQGY